MKRKYICHINQLKQAYLVLSNFKRQRVEMTDSRTDADIEDSLETSEEIPASGMNILDLPPELIYLIFSFCDRSHLFTSVQYVCKHWNELLQATHLWKGHKLVFDRDIPCHELMRHIRSTPSFEALSYSYTSCNRFVTCLIRHCFNLTWLKLNGDFYVPFSILHTLENLQHLDLNLRWKWDRILYGKVDIDPNMTGLTKISKLKTLIVRNFHYHGRFLVDCIEECPNLQHIYLSKIDHFETYVDPDNIDETKSTSNHLQTVYFHCQEPPPWPLIGNNLLKAIGKHRRLQSLVLKPNNYKDNDFTEFLFNEKFPEMVTLDIGYSSWITDSVMPALVESCPNLVNFSVNRCSITNNSLDLFMKKLHLLENFNLHGTSVTSEIFDSIPLSLPKLKALNLCSCRFVHQCQVLPLLDAFPNIMILDRRGDFIGGAAHYKTKWPFLSLRNALA